jgi:hypothetical protein
MVSNNSKEHSFLQFCINNKTFGIIISTHINECNSSPCQNSGKCNDQINGYICTCTDGLTVTHCETSEKFTF